MSRKQLWLGIPFFLHFLPEKIRMELQEFSFMLFGSLGEEIYFMKTKLSRRLRVSFFVAALLLLSACSAGESGGHDKRNSDALTWGTWANYGKHEPFLKLLEETYPEVELEFISYAGSKCHGLQLGTDAG